MAAKTPTHQEIYKFPYDIEAHKTSFVKCLYVEVLADIPGILVLTRCLKAGRNTGGFNYTYWYIIATKTLVDVRHISIDEVNSRKKARILDD